MRSSIALEDLITARARKGDGGTMVFSLSDELIMAFADGELEPCLAAYVREAIENDDAIRHKQEIFRSTRAVLARSFDPVLIEPVPERLKRAIRRA
jgi:anti-sigma factor RsiW